MNQSNDISNEFDTLFWLEIRKISKNYDDFCDVYNSLLMLLWFILFLALMLYSWLIYLLLLHIVDGNPTRWYFAAAQHDFPCDGGNICKRPEFCCFTGLQTIWLCFMPFFCKQLWVSQFIDPQTIHFCTYFLTQMIAYLLWSKFDQHLALTDLHVRLT